MSDNKLWTDPNLKKDAPAFYIHLMLENSKVLLTPRYFRQFAEEAGLEHFIENPPLMGVEAVASYDQTAFFMAKVYEVLGNEVYPLFGQNFGMSSFKFSKDGPLIQGLKTAFEPIAKNPEFSKQEKLRKLVKLLNKYWLVPGESFELGEGNLSKIGFNCPYCRAIKTNQMLCYSSKAFHLAHFKFLTNWSFASPEQYKSVTVGDRFCAVRFTPVGF